MTTKKDKQQPKAVSHVIRHKYIVFKPFKYGNKSFNQGDEFVPEGRRFDAKLIKSHTRMQREVVAND